jgi:hypothetical protein
MLRNLQQCLGCGLFYLHLYFRKRTIFCLVVTWWLIKSDTRIKISKLTLNGVTLEQLKLSAV